MRFFRSNFAQIAIAIQTNEALGLLQTDYIEDIDGIDGQLSIVSSTGVKRSFLVSVISNELSGCLLQGRINLSLIGDGFYSIQGYARDTLGNITAIFQEIEIRNGVQFVPTTFKAIEIPTSSNKIRIAISDYQKTIKLPTNVAAQRLRIPSGNTNRIEIN